MKTVFLLLLCTVFFSCSKRDPHPEAKDEIYSDLLVELDLATKGVEAAEKEAEAALKDIKKATPQTGQINTYENKYFEAKNNLDRLKQQKQYFEIKVEERKQEAQIRYEESLTKGGRKWPDPQEVAAYKLRLKLYREKMEWDKNRGGKKLVPEKKDAKAAGGEHVGTEAPASEEHH